MTAAKIPSAEQLPFDLGHRSAFARDDFWVSSSNQDAVAWLDKWPEWPAPLLVLYGPAASGKTHLLQVWKNEAKAEIFDPAAVEKSGAAVLIDDIDTLIGNPAREEAVFHLYNLMKEKGGHILVSAKTPQASWRFTLPDLKSRLMAAPAVAVGAPDDQLMAVVLTKLFSDRQVAVPQEVVNFILPRIERSFEALRDIAARIDRKALSEKRAVTVPLARAVLEEQGRLL